MDFQKWGQCKRLYVSQKNLFTNPTVNKKIPNFIFSFLKLILFFKEGINSGALKIGPAINCGKYIKNSANDEKFRLSLYFLVFMSISIATIVNVINDIANGNSDL